MENLIEQVRIIRIDSGGKRSINHILNIGFMKLIQLLGK